LPHKAFALQIRQNHGLQLFCATSFAHFPALQQKLAMPLQPHRPPSFCPLSPEAYLLTEACQINPQLTINRKKKLKIDVCAYIKFTLTRYKPAIVA
jgi:hypothetical protein